MMMAMKIILLLLFSSTVSGLGSVLWKTYRYYNSYRTWENAQTYCRTHHTDLALYHTQSDRDRLHFSQYYAWIGLNKSSDDTWTWTVGNELTNFKYGPNETNNLHRCAFYSLHHRRMFATNCGGTIFFICHEGEDNKNYRFISLAMTWSEAQQYCLTKNMELAAFPNVSKLNSNIHEENFPAWIGLHREEGTWKWSTGESEYKNWSPNQPGDNHNCATIFSQTKQMCPRDCSSRLPFICFRYNLILVKENKTWEEALEHCRAMGNPHRHELVSVQPGEDHKTMIANIVDSDTEEVWTGLRFLGGQWWWVNGADMLFSDLPACPVKWDYCGALSKNDSVNMKNRDCLEKKNFLCYRY
ncbi:secretory phospholipase A2 receptor-like [Notolabrus celidotus]|uniref:secretory phospholipase A2 receptor-like n=1 Tax=Notolabrus celidotus TaxID=1203425 RepID=UPI00148FF80C|nr:secretory phospholipase A2 receptor-like [Notolabrus celidotus]